MCVYEREIRKNQEGLLDFIKCLFGIIQYMMKCFCVAIDMTHHSNIFPVVEPCWHSRGDPYMVHIDMLNMFLHVPC